MKEKGYAFRVTTLSKILAMILFISLPFIGYFVGFGFKNNLLRLCDECTKSCVINTATCDQKYKTFRGTLRKEPIPKELELGEYWYVFYFDDPYLLEENAAGRPMYIKQIVVNGPKDNFYNLDDFVDKHVEIKGEFGNGYAESTVLNITAITNL